MWNWNDPNIRKRHRTQIIKAWFDDVDRIDGPGMLLMSWETRLSAEEWWEMVLDMIRLAPDARCLGGVAAGPLENLIARHGAEIIERVEVEAVHNPKLVMALGKIWKSSIPDEVWERILKVLDPPAIEDLPMKEL